MNASFTRPSASSYSTASLNLFLGIPLVPIILQPVIASRDLRNLLFAIVICGCLVSVSISAKVRLKVSRSLLADFTAVEPLVFLADIRLIRSGATDPPACSAGMMTWTSGVASEGKQASASFDVALRESFALTQFAEAVANNHGGIIPLSQVQCNYALRGSMPGRPRWGAQSM